MDSFLYNYLMLLLTEVQQRRFMLCKIKIGEIPDTAIPTERSGVEGCIIELLLSAGRVSGRFYCFIIEFYDLFFVVKVVCYCSGSVIPHKTTGPSVGRRSGYKTSYIAGCVADCIKLRLFCQCKIPNKQKFFICGGCFSAGRRCWVSGSG